LFQAKNGGIDAVASADSDLIVLDIPVAILKTHYESGWSEIYRLSGIIGYAGGNKCDGESFLGLVKKYGAASPLEVLLHYGLLAGCDYFKVLGVGKQKALEILWAAKSMSIEDVCCAARERLSKKTNQGDMAQCPPLPNEPPNKKRRSTNQTGAGSLKSLEELRQRWAEARKAGSKQKSKSKARREANRPTHPKHTTSLRKTDMDDDNFQKRYERGWWCFKKAIAYEISAKKTVTLNGSELTPEMEAAVGCISSDPSLDEARTIGAINRVTGVNHLSEVQEELDASTPVDDHPFPPVGQIHRQIAITPTHLTMSMIKGVDLTQYRPDVMTRLDDEWEQGYLRKIN
jgi:hypothetical protein